MQKENKTVILNARLKPSEMEMVERYIKDNAIKNKSNFIRSLIIERIKREQEVK